jgi:hypothetical protein
MSYNLEETVLTPTANNSEQMVRLAPYASLNEVQATLTTIGIASMYRVFCLHI